MSGQKNGNLNKEKKYHFYGKMVETEIRCEHFNDLCCKSMFLFFCRAFVKSRIKKKRNTSICLTMGIIYNRSTDMWGLGCLIWEVFNGSLSQINSLKSVGKVSA